jgi:pyruvate dehydrogenase (quinone)
MPPKVTEKHVGRLAQSLVKGEPNRDTIALTVISDKVRELA